MASPPSTTTTAAPVPTTEPTPVTAVAKPSGPYALASFTSCTSLLRHLKREATKAVTPWGLPGSPLGGRRVFAMSGGMAMEQGAAQPLSRSSDGATAGAAASADSAGGPSFSGTNIQEEGVDEPDVVKTDGKRLVVLVDNVLKIVDLTTPAPKVLGELGLPQGDAASELLLAGDRVLLFSHLYLERAHSRMAVIDISNPANPTTAATMTFEGNYVSARLAAGVVRLVITHDPKGPRLVQPYGMEQPSDYDALVAKHQAAIRRSTVEDWLPTYTVERGGPPSAPIPLVPCAGVLRPKDFAGLAAVSVLTIDPADPKPTQVACVLGGGRIVYASPKHLYVATETFTTVPWRAQADPAVSDSRFQPPSPPSQIHQFAIPGRQPAVYTASGQVAGSLLNQFSMSEHDGVLRVATTTQSMDAGRGGTDNLVQTLRADKGQLAVVGTLKGLGHEGETIQSVRFIGTRGYVVTFRQTDPLYVIDLRDPGKPKPLGELQVPGFSSYLHPLSDTALLGVGQGPDDRGGQGLQVSLFDVADPARPVRLANQVFNGAYSSAQQDHHAFLWWAPAGKLVLPFQQYRYDAAGVNGALVLPVDPAKGFGAHTVVPHESPVLRAMVSEGRLLTISHDGVRSNDVQTLADRSLTRW